MTTIFYKTTSAKAMQIWLDSNMSATATKFVAVTHDGTNYTAFIMNIIE